MVDFEKVHTKRIYRDEILFVAERSWGRPQHGRTVPTKQNGNKYDSRDKIRRYTDNSPVAL